MLITRYWSVFAQLYQRNACDSAHAGWVTITTSPFQTDRVMWGCVRLSELPSSSSMMNSVRSLQWEWAVWGCLPQEPVLPVYGKGLLGWICIHTGHGFKFWNENKMMNLAYVGFLHNCVLQNRFTFEIFFLYSILGGNCKSRVQHKSHGCTISFTYFIRAFWLHVNILLWGKRWHLKWCSPTPQWMAIYCSRIRATRRQMKR